MKHIRMTAGLIGVALSSVSVASAQMPVDPTRPIRSATKARDVNGFELGMHIRDADKIAPVESIGNGQFETEREGVRYNFGATPTGRIYRVQSSQTLGRFGVDAVFLQELLQKFSLKYGPPESVNGEVFSWRLIEPVKERDGSIRPFETMWFSAYVTGGSDPVTLEMTMIDFRLLWADQASLNQRPRDEAADAIRF